MSHVKVSFDNLSMLVTFDGLGYIKNIRRFTFIRFRKNQKYLKLLIRVIRFYKKNKTTKYYMMKIHFYPRSPYGVAKIYAFWITKNYRGVIICLRVMEYCLI